MTSVRLSTLKPAMSRPGRMLHNIEEQTNSLAQVVTGKGTKDFAPRELVFIGLTFNEKGDYVEAKKYLNEALKSSAEQKLNQPENAMIEANCHYGLANAARELNQEDEAIKLFIQASEDCQKIKNTDEQVSLNYEILRNLGITYLKKDEFELAAKCFSGAMLEAKKTTEPLLLPSVTSYYGLALVRQGKGDLGFDALKQARKLFPKEKRDQSFDYASHLFHTGRAFEATKEEVHAIIAYEQALEIRKKLMGPIIGKVYRNSRLGDVQFALGRCYFVLHKFERAQKYFEKAHDNFNDLKDQKNIQEIESYIKKIALKKGKGPEQNQNTIKPMNDLPLPRLKDSKINLFQSKKRVEENVTSSKKIVRSFSF